MILLHIYLSKIAFITNYLPMLSVCNYIATQNHYLALTSYFMIYDRLGTCNFESDTDKDNI
jgi:hypothetical protein